MVLLMSIDIGTTVGIVFLALLILFTVIIVSWCVLRTLFRPILPIEVDEEEIMEEELPADKKRDYGGRINY